jgi:hypothetical protein
MTTVITIKSHVQTFSNAKTYLTALLFIIDNIPILTEMKTSPFDAT